MSHAADRPAGGRISRGRVQAVAERVHGPPEAPSIQYEGLVTRTIAFALDAGVINLTAIAVSGAIALGLSVLNVHGGLKTLLIAIAGVAYIVWSVAYFVVFWSTTGQTPGNRLLRIRVCLADTGEPVHPLRALVRLVALMLAVIPLFAGLLPILVDDRRRGLQDIIAGTVVVAAEPA